ncbi:hypothetical protein D3Z36_14745 [Lachnospiraceae bacterium]|nr:hypothetical protein [Lachnospiraceae bacterium]
MRSDDMPPSGTRGQYLLYEEDKDYEYMEKGIFICHTEKGKNHSFIFCFACNVYFCFDRIVNL